MSVITTPIPPQAFELIRDQLGVILYSEIRNQALGFGNYLMLATTVWRERIAAFAHNELPAVNISFVGGPYDSQDSRQVQGTYSYNIDCYASAKAQQDSEADLLALTKLHRLLGVCRAILMDPRYKTLGFQPPFIGNRTITNLLIDDPNRMDATMSVRGRLVLTVKVQEITDLINPPKIQDFVSDVRLYSTDNGYFWKGVTP